MAGPGRPPLLAGLTYVGPIGTGGFADVYLYRQEFPARQVAVKVLRESSDAAGVAQFRAEECAHRDEARAKVPARAGGLWAAVVFQGSALGAALAKRI